MDSGKTSVLFHYAAALAKVGKRPYLVCKRAKMEQVPPSCPPVLCLDDPALDHIQMRCPWKHSL